MIVVSGAMRSGTSAWMQILGAAGFRVLGDAFNTRAGEHLREGNPRGFFETPFVAGVWWATNPDPETGAWLAPAAGRRLAVKVFVPGLTRTDIAYLDHVLATFRDWRSFGPSLRRLRALAPADRPRPPEPPIPEAIDWWFCVYDLLRDAATRGYPLRILSYERLLADPEATTRRVLDWLGAGDAAAAARAVAPELRTQSPSATEGEALEPELRALFDELYDHLHRERALAPAFVEELNRAHGTIVERWPGRAAL